MPLTHRPTAARDEMRRLVHGPCDPAFLSELHKALAADAPADSAGAQLLQQLGLLSETLPYDLFDDPARLTAAHAWAAVADPSLCLAALVHHLLCLGSMAELGNGSDDLTFRMAALRSGRARGIYLITEAGQANSHLATRTRAELDTATGEFVLHTPDEAAAKFGSAGTLDVPQTAVVLARLVTGGTDHGVFAFVADLTGDGGPLPGVEISSPIGLSALPLDYVQVRFHHARLPHAHWLADGAHIAPDGTFDDPAGSAAGRLQRTLRVGQGLWATMPAVAAATSRQAAVQAVAYAQGRRTQGRLAPGVPLLTYRTQQRAVLGALADAFALTCAAHGARALWEESRDAPAEGGVTEMGVSPWTAVSRPLAAYKAATVRLAARVTAECQRRCGFSGHLDANRLAGYHGFHHAFDTAGGDSQLIFYDIGSALAEAAEREASDGDAAGRDADGLEADGRKPDSRETDSRGTDDRKADAGTPPSPLSPGWWPMLVRRHRHDLTRHLAKRLGGTEAAVPFEVWNPLLEDAGALGEAYADSLIAEDVVRTLAGTQDRDLARALRPLAALHGVMAARRRSGSLLALETLRPADVRALSDAADRLCDEVRPHLPLLIEAFAHPTDLAPADCDTALRTTLTRTGGGTA
ncbi:acyl-CoA dehydrogenase family protein [Streptomyces sp. HD]|uniref:acyl-CoA dehydrogenase family protein n=1 Tax=Streptomyces sp. HD TaxID=3020892 RepID=UPI00232B18DC|nr:acyl-CoA dehydrogenase [Streptomyces sp. HD]MDC0770687.1 acyl-CoA dehydrogenase [Streptomyces sp. HD]